MKSSKSQRDRYKVLDVAGRGGMSTVYRARDEMAEWDVAIKVMHAHLVDDVEMVEAFEREARLMQQVDDPGVVDVYGMTEIDGRPAIVMEYCPGDTLDERLARSTSFDESRAIEITVSVLETLEALHQQGIVHRDIKPHNIIFDGDDRPRLIDFGIGCADEWMEFEDDGQVGTVEYMAPERIDGLAVDGRSDLYSAGIVLFEMVTGRPPFRADAASAVMRMHRRQEVPDPGRHNSSLSDRLCSVVGNALQKHPEERFDTAAEMAGALRGEGNVVDDIEDHSLWTTLIETYGGTSSMVAPIERSGHEWVVYAVDYDRFDADGARALREIIVDNDDHLAVSSGPVGDVIDVMRTGTDINALLGDDGDTPENHGDVKWRQFLGAYGVARGLSKQGAEQLVEKLEGFGIVARFGRRRRRRREPTWWSKVFSADNIAAATVMALVSGIGIYIMAARQLAADGGQMSPALMVGFVGVFIAMAVASSWAASAGMIGELWKSNFSDRYLLDFCRTRSEISGDAPVGRAHIDMVQSIQSPRIAASVERALNMALHLRDWFDEHDLAGIDQADATIDSVTDLAHGIVDVEATISAVRPGEIASRLRQLEHRIAASDDIDETERWMEQKSELRRQLKARDEARQRLEVLGQRLLDVANRLETMVRQSRDRPEDRQQFDELSADIAAAAADLEEQIVFEFDSEYAEREVRREKMAQRSR